MKFRLKKLFILMANASVILSFSLLLLTPVFIVLFMSYVDNQINGSLRDLRLCEDVVLESDGRFS